MPRRASPWNSCLFAACVAGVLLQFAQVTPASEAETLRLLVDTDFSQGFEIKSPSGNIEGHIEGTGPGEPLWQVAQWASGSSIYYPERFEREDGALRFQDAYKLLCVEPGGVLTMGVNAYAEYGGVYRQHGQPWPHLYVTQRISPPGGHLGEQSPSLAELAAVNFTIEARLLQDKPHRGEGYNPRWHAAQYVIFFTVQNLNRDSAQYGDYLWFGISVYDDRHEVTPTFAMPDAGQGTKKGTGKLIYSIGMDAFGGPRVGSGEWVRIEGDLLPHMKDALEEAWKRGYLEASRSLADYRIGGYVMGFEVPGLNDIVLAVRNLEASATLKQAEQGDSGG